MQKSQAYSNFADTLKTDATRVIYDRALEQFMAWSKIKSHDRLAKLKRKDAESKIISYIRYLKEQKRAPMTVRMKVAPLKHFFVMNDVVLNWEKIMKFVGGAKIVTQDRIYTKQEIQKILEKCDERKRVMFLLLVSSGIRIGALPGIRIKHLYKWQNEGIYQIIVYGDEPDASYTTFCTVECAMAIESYLDYRRKRGEEIKPDTPLIREQFHPRDANKPKPIALNGIMSILSRTLEDSGVRQHSKEANKRKEVMRFHGFRKFFNTSLNKAGVKPIIKELLMGHKVGLEQNYLRPADEELLQEYLKALDLLTISEEKHLRHQVEKLKTDVADIDTMKKGYLDTKLELEREKQARMKLEEDFNTRVEEEVKKRMPSAEEIAAIVTQQMIERWGLNPDTPMRFKSKEQLQNAKDLFLQAAKKVGSPRSQ